MYLSSVCVVREITGKVVQAWLIRAARSCKPISEQEQAHQKQAGTSQSHISAPFLVSIMTHYEKKDAHF